MIRLTGLANDPADIFDACVNGIDHPELKARFLAVRADTIAKFQEYRERAAANKLHLFHASAWGNDDQVVAGTISKKEFVDLYSVYMVGKNKPARTYYDQLMMLAPLGKCPLCGFGQASTLDHFLSKSRYPGFSALSLNLIPACADCNKGKGSAVLNDLNQTVHPYFESEAIENCPWLFAEIIKSTPITVRYFVKPPDSWSGDLTERVKNTFADLDLARRYAVEAAADLAGLRGMMHDIPTFEIRAEHLARIARIERRDRKNSWKAALYEALANTPWYLQEGYLL